MPCPSAPPLGGGMLAAVLTTWVTYVPCFLFLFVFVFVGAPWIEALRGNTDPDPRRDGRARRPLSAHRGMSCAMS